MNAGIFLLPCLLALAFPAMAEEPAAKSSSDVDAAITTRGPLRLNTNPAYWDQYITKQKEFAPIQLGRSGFNLGGPIVDAFRPHRYAGERSLGQKILDLPVLRLFVPGPMPNPPESGGHYFAWRTDDARAWSTAAGSAGIPGNKASYLDHQPAGTLLRIGK